MKKREEYITVEGSIKPEKLLERPKEDKKKKDERELNKEIRDFVKGKK